MKAFVAGATGETGRRIVKELVQRGIPVRAMVRDLEKGKQVLPAEAELVVGDVLQPGQLQAAIGDSTVLFSATGAAPSFDPTGPYKVDFEGTKIWLMLPKQPEFNTLSWCLRSAPPSCFTRSICSG